MSGPILDRIDLWIHMPNVEYTKLEEESASEKSKSIKKRVSRARETQHKRFKGKTMLANSQMNVRDIKKYAPLGSEEKKILAAAAERLELSARAYHRVIKVARTIADLAGSKEIKKEHLLEALQFRPAVSYS